MIDDNNEAPRQPHEYIVKVIQLFILHRIVSIIYNFNYMLFKQLREAIVNHTCGSMENLSIKFHYDNMVQ